VAVALALREIPNERDCTATMQLSIDRLYSSFLATLPTALAELGRDLPHVLGLAPRAGLGWDDVFSHRVTLAAPHLLSEGCRVSAAERAADFDERVQDATLAHALSVIEAFASDRILDGQIVSTSELVALVEELRVARDRLLERVFPGTSLACRAADEATLQAIREERALLGRFAAVSFHDYERVSLGKQAVGFPASSALLRAFGASERQVRQAELCLRGVWLGLQFEDDVADWEDDFKRGAGAWPVSLARRRVTNPATPVTPAPESHHRRTEPDMVRRRVLDSRVLYSMLTAARRQYRAAYRHARALGAAELSAWAEARMRRLDELLPLEARHAGFVVRSRQLASFAAEVLT
jgi:hypothetical protein